MMYPLAGWTYKGQKYLCAKCHPQFEQTANYSNGWWWFDTYVLDNFIYSFFCDNCEQVK